MLGRISSSTSPIKPSKSSDVVREGLICCYEFSTPGSYSSSAGSTVTDLIGNSNASLQNSPAYTSPVGQTAGYLQFNGTNQYLVTQTNLNSKLSPANTSTIISVFVWVYMSDNGVIVSELGQTTPNTGWHDSQIEMVSNTLKFRVWNSANPTLTVNTDYRNGWHLIGYTISPKTSGENRTLTAYVDGVNVGSNTQTAWTQSYSGSVSHSIGSLDRTSLGDGTAGDFRFNSFYLYGKALTSTEVLNLYTLTKGCKR